jgi:hypothetical protein
VLPETIARMRTLSTLALAGFVVVTAVGCSTGASSSAVKRTSVQTTARASKF